MSEMVKTRRRVKVTWERLVTAAVIGR